MAAKGAHGPNTEMYKKLFKEADKNGDGFLSVHELRDLLKRGGSSMTDAQVAVSVTCPATRSLTLTGLVLVVPGLYQRVLFILIRLFICCQVHVSPDCVLRRNHRVC